MKIRWLTKWLTSKGLNFDKINLIFIKKATCTFSWCPQSVFQVWKQSIENCGRSGLHNRSTLTCKSCQKWLNSKDHKCYLQQKKKSHAHLYHVHNVCTKFDNKPNENLLANNNDNTAHTEIRTSCHKLDIEESRCRKDAYAFETQKMKINK